MFGRLSFRAAATHWLLGTTDRSTLSEVVGQKTTTSQGALFRPWVRNNYSK